MPRRSWRLAMVLLHALVTSFILSVAECAKIWSWLSTSSRRPMCFRFPSSFKDASAATTASQVKSTPSASQPLQLPFPTRQGIFGSSVGSSAPNSTATLSPRQSAGGGSSRSESSEKAGDLNIIVKKPDSYAECDLSYRLPSFAPVSVVDGRKFSKQGGRGRWKFSIAMKPVQFRSGVVMAMPFMWKCYTFEAFREVAATSEADSFSAVLDKLFSSNPSASCTFGVTANPVSGQVSCDARLKTRQFGSAVPSCQDIGLSCEAVPAVLSDDQDPTAKRGFRSGIDAFRRVGSINRGPVSSTGGSGSKYHFVLFEETQRDGGFRLFG